MTSCLDVGLVIQYGHPEVAIGRPPPLPSTNSKEKRACSPFPTKKVKKSKGSSLPSDTALGPNEMLAVVVEVEGGAPQDLVGTVP